MARKRVELKMFVLVLVFGIMFVGCAGNPQTLESAAIPDVLLGEWFASAGNDEWFLAFDMTSEGIRVRGEGNARAPVSVSENTVTVLDHSHEIIGTFTYVLHENTENSAVVMEIIESTDIFAGIKGSVLVKFPLPEEIE